MAVSFVARKCDQCAGKLQYIKEKKIWKCLYCGAEIVREEQYDGLFTVKNVVRQALLDVAYRRLESAQKNLTECEKIDSHYVGTLIAKIADEIITVITPGACPANDEKNIFSQLKKNYDLLKEQNPVITDDEEALYEFFEEADIYATLVLVFDSLNDTSRRDLVASMLDASQVYSKAANGNLLNYAIKNNNTDMVDTIISNADNIDAPGALNEILSDYPDGENKAVNARRLLEMQAVKQDGKQSVEHYIAASADAVSTKSAVTAAALENGIRVGLDAIITNVLALADKEQTVNVVSAVCGNKLTDDEVLTLADFGFASGNADIAISILDCLKQSGQFLLVSSKMLIPLLSIEGYSSAEKVKIIEKCTEFKVENKAFEALLTNFLCYCPAARDRKLLLEFLLKQVAAIPTNTVEAYVLKSNADGDGKPEIISMLFDKGLNTTFFNDLLSNYMGSDVDTPEVKSEIVSILSDKGLKTEPSSLIDYVCNSSDDVYQKLAFVKKMAGNGSQIRGDAANTYLESVEPAQFSSELFSLLCCPGSMFSGKSIAKYMLDIKDREANKLDNIITIIEHSSVSASSLICDINHLGHRIECNLIQAYILTTTDSYQLAEQTVSHFVNNEKLKLNAEMSVAGNGMKLKKYAVANRESLSAVTDALCDKFKIYSMLF